MGIIPIMGTRLHTHFNRRYEGRGLGQGAGAGGRLDKPQNPTNLPSQTELCVWTVLDRMSQQCCVIGEYHTA